MPPRKIEKRVIQIIRTLRRTEKREKKAEELLQRVVHAGQNLGALIIRILLSQTTSSHRLTEGIRYRVTILQYIDNS